MIFRGNDRRALWCALAMLLLPGMAVADTVAAEVYQVTRFSEADLDTEGYTLAGAIEAASATPELAIIEIMRFSVLVTETLVIDTPVRIQRAPDLDYAVIHARLTALCLSSGPAPQAASSSM